MAFFFCAKMCHGFSDDSVHTVALNVRFLCSTSLVDISGAAPGSNKTKDEVLAQRVST